MTTLRELNRDIREVRLLLVRDKEHPADATSGYDLVLPLDLRGYIDVAEWKARAAECRVRRFRPDQEDRIGRLRRKPGGRWCFDYGEDGEDGNLEYLFGTDRFVAGEHVSVLCNGAVKTYEIARVTKP
jgi:hypothetical protein